MESLLIFKLRKYFIKEKLILLRNIKIMLRRKEEELHQAGYLSQFLLANFVRVRVQCVVCLLNCVPLRRSTVRWSVVCERGGVRRHRALKTVKLTGKANTQGAPPLLSVPS